MLKEMWFFGDKGGGFSGFGLGMREDILEFGF